MNYIEENLWAYIDGSCTEEEHNAITRLVAENEIYRNKYYELLKLNAEFTAMELDEPSMAFTYNVIETIRTENALKPLKASVNKRIIWGIAAFFIVTIIALLIFVLTSVNYGTIQGVRLPLQLAVTSRQGYFSGALIKVFVFFDIVTGLFLLDLYMRKRNGVKQY